MIWSFRLDSWVLVAKRDVILCAKIVEMADANTSHTRDIFHRGHMARIKNEKGERL